MLGFKTLTAPGVRSDHARPQDNTGTDMPVLLPFRAKHNKDGFFVHHDGRLFVDMKLRHGLMIFAVFALWGGAAEAAAKVGGLAWAMASLWEWTPFILKGFSLNILISVLAMLIGTIAGAALGLMQVSLLAPVRGSSWIVTQFFRNSPWLVLLFCVMLLFPFEIDLGFVVIPIPDWMKAVIGFSLPIMANISEVVRGAVISLPSGQWESAESLAFSRRQTMWMIILPQCIKRMVPPWINWYCILTMATPLCSIMGVEESVGHTVQAMNALGDRPELLAPFYFFLLFIHFIFTYPIARFSISLEKKFAVKI
jgi:polar amino acid transport system permease protein